MGKGLLPVAYNDPLGSSWACMGRALLSLEIPKKKKKPTGKNQNLMHGLGCLPGAEWIQDHSFVLSYTLLKANKDSHSVLSPMSLRALRMIWGYT
jgi:hypothetical protein